MVSARCKAVVKDELKRLGLHFIVVDLGEVEIMETLSTEEWLELKSVLLHNGLELMDDKRAILIEQIKNVIIEEPNETPLSNPHPYNNTKAHPLPVLKWSTFWMLHCLHS